MPGSTGREMEQEAAQDDPSAPPDGPRNAAGAWFPSFKEAKAEFVRGYIVQCLLAVQGNVAAAARLAGKDRKDFYDLMKRHHVLPADYRR